MEAQPELTNVESLFIRERNILAVRVHMTPIYTDYYLHLMEQKLKYKPELDLKLKELLAALTLHLTARPWAETIAWTANLRAPRINLFATGTSTGSTDDNGATLGHITGRLFTEDIREPDHNYLYSQTLLPGKEPRKSIVQVDDADPLDWVSEYYLQSEQRPGRVFELPDETFILLAAQPDFDEEWFNEQTVESLIDLEKNEQTKLLETRSFKWHCINIQCPRCAATYPITPDQLD